MSVCCDSIPFHVCKPGLSSAVVRYGFFFRKDDSAKVQRYRCTTCKKAFSQASNNLCFRQQRRTINRTIALLLVSGVSQRRAALILKANRKTVVRKLVFLGLCARGYLTQNNLERSPAQVIEFDDLETTEHTKLKPLSVTLAVESKTRRILGFRVSKMPAKGHLAAKSREKYGRRKDERRKNRDELFNEIKPMIDRKALIKSDENPHYAPEVRKYFPEASYQTHKGRRGCVAGQGELKKIGFDPLFSINHTYAMLRANINRLFRRTWCITKKPENLAHHIALYAVFHNRMPKTA
jgi:hypothetical protein